MNAFLDTSRPKKDDELDGRDYHFVPRVVFGSGHRCSEVRRIRRVREEPVWYECRSDPVGRQLREDLYTQPAPSGQYPTGV